VAAVAVCGAAFGVLTGMVVAGSGLVGLDDDVERVVGEHRVGWVTTSLKILTWLGSTAVLWPVVGIVALLLIMRSHRWRDAAFIALALAGSVLISDVVKGLVDRPRPPASVRLVHVTGTAYPSGHAIDATVAFVALALVLSKGRSRNARASLFSSAVLVALVVGWSRIYLGTHWLTDVLGGYALGGLLVASLAVLLVKPGGEPARTEPYPQGLGP
jgi:membrane-associated phospholipid phosphatase